MVLVSHLDRPEGFDPALSMAPVAARLADLLGTTVRWPRRWPGPRSRRLPRTSSRARSCCSRTAASNRARRATTRELARGLAALADLYVDDAFGAAHRAHATTEGVARLLPAYAGLLLEREVRELTAVRDDPARPLCVVLGGAKVTDKIGVIERFLDSADQLLIGGAMCFSFFSAQGIATGDSLVEEDGVELARERARAPRASAVATSSCPSTW